MSMLPEGLGFSGSTGTPSHPPQVCVADEIIS